MPQKKLRRKKKHLFDNKTIDKVISFFKEEGEIDDRRFIDWFVKGRLKTRPKSPFLLRRELHRLGIKQELIDDYFAGKRFEEEVIALRALRLKSKRWRGEKGKVFPKMVNFLRRRGFSSQSIKRAIADFPFKE